MRALPLVACLLIGGVVADRTSQPRGAGRRRPGAPGRSGIAGGVAHPRPAEHAGGRAAGRRDRRRQRICRAGHHGDAARGVAPEQLGEANGLRATAFSIGELGGPLLSGVLVATAGPGWALGIDALTFAASAALLIGLRRVPVPGRASARLVPDRSARRLDRVSLAPLAVDVRGVGRGLEPVLGSLEGAGAGGGAPPAGWRRGVGAARSRRLARGPSSAGSWPCGCSRGARPSCARLPAWASPPRCFALAATQWLPSSGQARSWPGSR